MVSFESFSKISFLSSSNGFAALRHKKNMTTLPNLQHYFGCLIYFLFSKNKPSLKIGKKIFIKKEKVYICARTRYNFNIRLKRRK